MESLYINNKSINNDENFDSKEIDSHIIDISIKKGTIDDSLIKFYNLFISSNHNYLYNKTYILDSLDKFKNNIFVLKRKYKVSQSLSMKFNSLKVIHNEWFVIIDDYYICTLKTNNEMMSYAELKKKIKESSENTRPSSAYLIYIKNKSEKYINCNNIYNIDKNKCLIRFFYHNQARLFSYRFETYQKDEEDETKTKVKRNNLKSEELLIQQIQLFIDDCNEKERRRR